VEIRDLVEAIRTRRVRISDHAYDEASNDGLNFDEIFNSALGGEIIEAYPEDRPYPSCLVYGQTPRGDAVHSVWAYHAQQRWAVLVTVYRPDPAGWIDWRERRSER